jgi:uncharacterized membrane protein YcaP (DUF421 family)
MSVAQVFGEGRDLETVHMAARAVAVFLVMLAYLHIAGMRTFGKKSTFDTIIVITLGALMSRVIVGASEALPTIVAGGVLVVLHRIIAMLTATVPTIERLVKGTHTVLYRGGVLDLEAMRRTGISRADLEEAVRAKANRLRLTDVLEIHLESSGELSVIDDVVGEARRTRTAIG